MSLHTDISSRRRARAGPAGAQPRAAVSCTRNGHRGRVRHGDRMEFDQQAVRYAEGFCPRLVMMTEKLWRLPNRGREPRSMRLDWSALLPVPSE